VTAQFADRLREAGIASETAMLHLLRAGRERLEADPDAVATIYEAAAQMALPRDSPRELVQSLQAHAYQGSANALRILGRLEEAAFCLARAGERFIEAGYCTDEAGQADYTRATIFAAMELWDDALPATQSALRSFTKAGNMRWVAKAEQLEAVLTFEHGDVDAAHEKWVRLTKVLAARRDREDLARVWLNLGICETLRKRPTDARRWLTKARTAFQKLDNTGELARTRWNMGTYFAMFEDGHRALRSFTSAYRGFLGLRMWLDAGCVALDIVDTMIDIGTPEDELTFMAGGAADTLARAGLRGITAALDDLRKIARHGDRHRVVRIVRAALLDAKASCSEVSFAVLGEAG
jgi:tetratricopeptide (TPR) repeat protein